MYTLFAAAFLAVSSIFTDTTAYDAIVVDPAVSNIQFYWEDFHTIGALKETLEKQHQHVLMITNGGMFHDNNIPVGLFISKGKIRRPLDTATTLPGNFYMQPNGVFYIDRKGAHIAQTQVFKEKGVLEATQSGPMLVFNGAINPLFDPRSKHMNLRSGVGILPGGKVVFIITKDNQVTLYDFAAIFKDKFGCKDALYLDGAISLMYLKGIRTEDLGGNFGAMIAVTEKE